MSQALYTQTYYEILEVTPGSPQDEIHRAYQRAKQTYSADSPALYTMFTKDEAKELIKLIEEAYNVLGNQDSRARYDQTLRTPAEELKSKIDNPVISSHTNVIVPDGYKKTRFGLFEVDDSFESEIAQCNLFDGEMIKKIRLYKKVTLEHISDYTRISRTYLSALEANDYGALPAAVFVRGFIVQVARVLQLDENKVAQSYMQLHKASHQ